MNLTLEEITKIKGIGKVKAIQLKATCELAKRINAVSSYKEKQILCPKDIAEILMEKMQFEKQEILKVAILNNNKELLMLHRKDNKKWTMPGGTLEFGESMVDCALREVKEESGLNVEIKDIIGTYTDPNIRVAYSDGEVRQEFTIVYYGETKDFDVKLDEESSNFVWVSLDEIQKLPLADFQRRRISNVISYLETGKKHLDKKWAIA